MEGPVRFGNAPTFDPQLFATPREHAEALYAGRTDPRYTPLDVADWLQALADGCDEALLSIRRSYSYDNAEVQRIAIDVGILSGMARFFAAKFRASVWVELFLISKVSELLDRAEARNRLRPLGSSRSNTLGTRRRMADDVVVGHRSHR